MDAFQDIFSDAGWKAPELLKAMQASEDFYCERLGLVKMASWSDGRVGLLGDAAFATGASGMGTTCAIVGAYVLAGEISRHCSRHDEKSEQSQQNDIATALKAYEDTLRPYIELIQKNAEASTGSWFLPSSRFGIEVSHLLVTALIWPKIDLVARFFISADVEKWKLPEFEALRRVEGELRG